MNNNNNSSSSNSSRSKVSTPTPVPSLVSMSHALFSGFQIDSPEQGDTERLPVVARGDLSSELMVRRISEVLELVRESDESKKVKEMVKVPRKPGQRVKDPR